MVVNLEFKFRATRTQDSSVASSCGPCGANLRGDILIEALVAVFLFAIAGMGISYIASQVAHSQHDMKVQQIAVNQLRSMVINRNGSSDLCDGAVSGQIAGAEVPVTVSHCSPGTARIGGLTLADVPAPVVLSAQVDAIGVVSVGGVAGAEE